MISPILRTGARILIWMAAIASLLAILLIILAVLSRNGGPEVGRAAGILIAGIVAVWLAGYGGVRAWRRRAAAHHDAAMVDGREPLPVWRRGLLIVVQAVLWPLIVGVAGFVAFLLAVGITRLPRLEYDDWERPDVLFASCMISFLAFIPLVLLDLLQRYSYRLRRERWMVPPRRVVYGASRLTERDDLLLITLGIPFSVGLVLALAQSLLSRAGISHPLIGIGFTALLGALTMAALAWRIVHRRRTELILDDDGLHVVTFRGWSVPWAAILDARLTSFQAKLTTISLLSLVIDRPERFGIRAGTGWWSRLCRWPVMASNAQVTLFVFLERPKHIFADIRAFMARTKAEGTAADTPAAP
jgi:hypothetical protein